MAHEIRSVGEGFFRGESRPRRDGGCNRCPGGAFKIRPIVVKARAIYPVHLLQERG